MINFRQKIYTTSELTPFPLVGINIVQRKYNVIISEPFQKFYKPPYDTNEYNWCWNIELPEPTVPEHRLIRLEKDSRYNPYVEYPGHSWSCHFLTGNNPDSPIQKSAINEDQKKRLFGALIDLIPIGDYLCTWGGIYYGAIPAFQRILKSGRFKLVGTRNVTVRPDNHPDILPILKKIK